MSPDHKFIYLQASMRSNDYRKLNNLSTLQYNRSSSEPPLSIRQTIRSIGHSSKVIEPLKDLQFSKENLEKKLGDLIFSLNGLSPPTNKSWKIPSSEAFQAYPNETICKIIKHVEIWKEYNNNDANGLYIENMPLIEYVVETIDDDTELIAQLIHLGV